MVRERWGLVRCNAEVLCWKTQSVFCRVSKKRNSGNVNRIMEAYISIWAHTCPLLEQEMHKIYAQALREKRFGGEDKKAHAWGSLAAGGTGSSDTKKGAGLKLGEYPEPLFKLC